MTVSFSAKIVFTDAYNMILIYVFLFCNTFYKKCRIFFNIHHRQSDDLSFIG